MEITDNRGTDYGARATGGLTTGIIGTSLAGLLALNQMRGGGGLFGGNNMAQEAAEVGTSALLAKIAKLEAEKETDKKVADVYAILAKNDKDLSTRVAAIEVALPLEKQLMQANINNLQTQISALQSVTQVTIPNRNICPGWGSVQITPVSGS